MLLKTGLKRLLIIHKIIGELFMFKKKDKLADLETESKKLDKKVKEKIERKQKPVLYEGNRWQSVILLAITVMASLFFYAAGNR